MRVTHSQRHNHVQSTRIATSNNSTQRTSDRIGLSKILMKIIDFESVPFRILPYLNAGRGPGQFTKDLLPIHRAAVDRLPDDTDAVIVTADLQGREVFPKGRPHSPDGLRLLGEVLPAELADDVLRDIGEFDPRRIGVLLAGDFYTVPALDKRGGSGDVTSVWQAFAEQFGWVVGVAGNHDTFGENRTKPKRLPSNSHYLDGEVVRVGGLKIAGLGGIIGNPQRIQRRTEDDYLQCLEELLLQEPSIIISHDGPDGPDNGQRGMPSVRNLIDQLPPPILIRGHAHWDVPFATLAGGTQVLNVDARVVVLTLDSRIA